MSLRTHHPFSLILMLCLAGLRLSAQMPVGSDTLYGNEWIKSGRAYWKVPVAADGFYRLSYEELLAAGVPVYKVPGDRWQLFTFGKEVPLMVPNPGLWGPGDSLVFQGQRHRMQLDRFYYDREEDILNPEYSLVSDTAWYFLCAAETGEATLRYQELPNQPDPAGASEPWFWSDKVQVYTSAHHQFNLSGIAESVLTKGQGFAGAVSANQTLTLDLPGLAPTAEPTQVALRLLASNANHELRVLWNSDTVYSETFSGWDLRQVSAAKPSDSLSGSQSIRVLGLASSSDRLAVSVLSARYPRRLQVGATNYLEVTLASGSGDRQLEFTGMVGGTYRLYCPEAGASLQAQSQGDTVRFLVPEALADLPWILSNATAGVSAPAGGPVPALRTLPAMEAGSFLLLTHPALRNDSGGDPVAEYAAYRNTSEGGGYPMALLEIQDLYDHFSYGMPRHPLAVRNFVHWLETEGKKPAHLLLVGKARQYNDTRSKAQLEAVGNQSFYLPVFGTPGSVNLLTTRRGTGQMSVPVGQLPAASPEEVRMYLDKVREHEAGLASTDPAERRWRKEALHLSGGRTEAEQGQIRGHLLDMEFLFENAAIGGNVTTFLKTSSDPVEYSVSQDLTRRINEGVSIMTFFGHSGAERFDFNVESPAKLANKGRYPLLISLGCGVGQTHTALRGLSEQFVFQPSKAALAFIGTASISYLNGLNVGAFDFYRRSGQEGYGGPIGENLRGSLNLMQSYSGLGYRLIHQQLTLNGDPALRLHAAPESDYRVVPGSVKTLPEGLTTREDSVNISFRVENLGRNRRDSVQVRVSHQLPDGQISDRTERTLFLDRLDQPMEVTLHLPGEAAEGENRIRIEIDPEGLLTQGPLPSARDNDDHRHGDGKRGHPLPILSNTAYPAWPPDLGIVGSDSVELRVFTADLRAPLQEYTLQIDTSPWYDSPALRSQTFRQPGGILRWTPDIDWPNSTVWYWRVRPGDGEYPWRSRSFLHLKGIPGGWNQSHPYQFKDNHFDLLTLDTTEHRIRYIDDIRTVRVRNAVYPVFTVGVDVDNDAHHFIVWDGPVNQGVYIFVFDPLTGKPWINKYPGLYGSRQPTSWATSHGHFPYWTNTAEWRKRAIDFLRDTIPSGHYVLLYTIQYQNTSYMPEAWAADSLTLGTNLFQVLEEQGAQLIRSTESSGAKPYAFMYRKDHPEWTPMERMVEKDQPLEETMLIEAIWDRGSMRSVPAGPATAWDQLHLAISDKEILDSTRVDLLGRDANGQLLPLLEDVQPGVTDISGIDPGLFPHLELSFTSQDTAKRSSPQVAHWRLLHEGLPDPALDPGALNTQRNDSLLQGAPVEATLAVCNLAGQDAGPFRVHLVWSDALGILAEEERQIAGLAPGGSVPLVWSWQDDRALGDHELSVAVNPDRSLREADLRNNSARFRFRFVPDERPPLLDVTFDGERISEGQLISAKPHIAVSLLDDNPWLRLDDSSGIEMYLKRPGQFQEEKVVYDGVKARFLPAPSSQDSANLARAGYDALFTESGLYRLRVSGKDRAGNAAQRDYEIRFLVEAQEAVTHFWITPNPVGSTGAFRYRKSGAEAIQDYRVRITDLVGRTMLILDGTELGPLLPGEHFTQGWDSSRLPSGMYHYELLTGSGLRSEGVRYGESSPSGAPLPLLVIP